VHFSRSLLHHDDAGASPEPAESNRCAKSIDVTAFENGVHREPSREYGE